MKNDRKLPRLKYLSILAITMVIMQYQVVLAQFANGADVSWLSQMEASGYVFRNNAGVKENCLQILKEKGINALRFRLWVNPPGGYCNEKDVAYMAHRADSMGFSVLLDFHLSDTWADPGHQTIPSAWANDTFPQLKQDVYNYVYGVLDSLKLIGIIPKWVQIGNEVGNGILWPYGKATNMSNFAALIQSGYNAVKAVDSTIQVIIHLEDGHNDALFRKIFDGLKANRAKWDIIGMSVYPYWANLSWQVDDSLALLTMKDMIARYNTKVMVCEAGYLYYQSVDAKNYLVDLIRKTKSVGGLGVFYWEPECYNWQNYNMGAWDPKTQEPTIAMDAFLDTTATSIFQEKNITPFEFNIYPNPFNPSTTIQYSLPKSEKVIVKIYNILGEPVKTLVDANEEAGVHSVIWSGRNDFNNQAASGIYLVIINYGKRFQSRKIVLLK